jgi:ADP-heptose:LPS heptosyltransferase
MRRVAVLRLDGFGDVLLAGPTVRAVAAAGDRVTLVCGARGEAAGRLLPGVSDLCVLEAPWIDPEPGVWRAGTSDRLVHRLRSLDLDAALVLTSFHQSPLPAALLLREAGVGDIHAVCVDYPGSLLNGRVKPDPAWHEVERGLAVAASAGCPPPPDRSLAVDLPPAPPVDEVMPSVVVHPGASVPTRALPETLASGVVAELASLGWRVLVTGTRPEAALTAAVADAGAVDLTGSTTAAELALVLSQARAVVVGNTGAAHLAAAVGTPVVSVFSPVVPWHQWRPWNVPAVRLGPTEAPCTGTRARRCPTPTTHCLDLEPSQVVAAVVRLAGAPSTRRPRADVRGAA